VFRDLLRAVANCDRAGSGWAACAPWLAKPDNDNSFWTTNFLGVNFMVPT
jgi:hypothetical protein